MPYLTPTEVPSGRICRPLFIPADTAWLAIVSGALTELTKEWNWEVGEDGITVEEALETVQEMIDRYYDEGCSAMDCPCPPIYREGQFGQLQVSLDGMETWEDVPLPPLPEPLPPAEGESNLCLSARNVTEVVYQTYSVVIAEFENGATIAVGIAAFVSVLALMIFFPPALPLVWTFFVQLWAVLTTLTAGDWTSGVTSQLTCIVIDNSTVGEDNVVTIDYNGLLSDVFAESTENQIWLAIWYLLLAAGEGSVNQAAQTRSIQTWNCGDCPGDVRLIISARDGFPDTPEVIIEDLGSNIWQVTMEQTSVSPNEWAFKIADEFGRQWGWTGLSAPCFNVSGYIAYYWNGSSWTSTNITGIAGNGYDKFIRTDPPVCEPVVFTFEAFLL